MSVSVRTNRIQTVPKTKQHIIEEEYRLHSLSNTLIPSPSTSPSPTEGMQSVIPAVCPLSWKNGCVYKDCPLVHLPKTRKQLKSICLDYLASQSAQNSAKAQQSCNRRMCTRLHIDIPHKQVPLREVTALQDHLQVMTNFYVAVDRRGSENDSMVITVPSDCVMFTSGVAKAVECFFQFSRRVPYVCYDFIERSCAYGSNCYGIHITPDFDVRRAKPHRLHIPTTVPYTGKETLCKHFAETGTKCDNNRCNASHDANELVDPSFTLLNHTAVRVPPTSTISVLLPDRVEPFMLHDVFVTKGALQALNWQGTANGQPVVPACTDWLKYRCDELEECTKIHVRRKVPQTPMAYSACKIDDRSESPDFILAIPRDESGFDSPQLCMPGTPSNASSEMLHKQGIQVVEMCTPTTSVGRDQEGWAIRSNDSPMVWIPERCTPMMGEPVLLEPSPMMGGTPTMLHGSHMQQVFQIVQLPHEQSMQSMQSMQQTMAMQHQQMHHQQQYDVQPQFTVQARSSLMERLQQIPQLNHMVKAQATDEIERYFSECANALLAARERMVSEVEERLGERNRIANDLMQFLGSNAPLRDYHNTLQVVNELSQPFRFQVLTSENGSPTSPLNDPCLRLPRVTFANPMGGISTVAAPASHMQHATMAPMQHNEQINAVQVHPQHMIPQQLMQHVIITK